VEIWSRFMKTAHQGVAVAALPGLAGGSSFASALSPGNTPLPPAPIAAQGAGTGVRPAPIERGLDGWFIDRLFGRR
jgi:penicillin-binding protein 1A